jgi:AcrR family transcriptional regulator
MKQTIDRRILYTKSALKDALFQLLLTKPIDKISVQELTDKAQINRVTFYQHYKSVNDMYISLQNEFLDVVMSILQNIKEMTIDVFMSTVVQLLFENRKFCESFFGKYGSINFLEKIIDGGKSMAIVYWRMKGISLTDTQYTLLYQFISGGFVSIIQNWIRNNFNTPISEITINVKKLVNIFEKNIFN